MITPVRTGHPFAEYHAAFGRFVRVPFLVRQKTASAKIAAARRNACRSCERFLRQRKPQENKSASVPRSGISSREQRMAAFDFPASLPIETFRRQAIFKPVPPRNSPRPSGVGMVAARRRFADHRADRSGMGINLTDETRLGAVLGPNRHPARQEGCAVKVLLARAVDGKLERPDAHAGIDEAP